MNRSSGFSVAARRDSLEKTLALAMPLLLTILRISLNTII